MFQRFEYHKYWVLLPNIVKELSFYIKKFPLTKAFIPIISEQKYVATNTKASIPFNRTLYKIFTWKTSFRYSVKNGEKNAVTETEANISNRNPS